MRSDESWNELPAEDRARLLARQGQQYPTADPVRVVDDQMRDVPRDATTMGEVVMRGNNVMVGYFADEAATQEAFTGGWFHSGDLAVWHPDGAIELRDRSKDVIISGGENISSIEVEQAICAHPAVLECAVVAIPHERWGERPKAFVTLKHGATASEEEIVAFCRGRLAHFKCPDVITFRQLPKTSTGKVQKYRAARTRVGRRRAPHQLAGRQSCSRDRTPVTSGRGRHWRGASGSPSRIRFGGSMSGRPSCCTILVYIVLISPDTGADTRDQQRFR